MYVPIDVTPVIKISDFNKKFDYPLYRHSEQSLQESISIYQVTETQKSGPTMRLRAFNITVLKHRPYSLHNWLSCAANVNRYTQYYLEQTGSGNMRPVYRDSFRVQRNRLVCSFIEGILRLLNLCFFSKQRLLERERLRRVRISGLVTFIK